MFKRFNLKKEYGVIAAAIVLLLVCYQWAFKKTIESWQLNKELKSQLVRSTDVSYQPGYLERKNTNLGKLINLYEADTVGLRNNIINAISSIAEKENVKLAEVPATELMYHNDIFIIQKLTFEGDYFALLRTLAQLQGKSKIGMVRGIAIKTQRPLNNSVEKAKLILEVYFEIIKH